MDIQIVEHSGVKFKVVNGTFYDINTNDKVIEVLENARYEETRLLLDYGHTDSGKSWGEEFDIRGYVGRSTGERQVPLLIFNSRSMGGGAILTHCIVKISTSKGGKVLYQHPTYQAYIHNVGYVK